MLSRPNFSVIKAFNTIRHLSKEEENQVNFLFSNMVNNEYITSRNIRDLMKKLGH